MEYKEYELKDLSKIISEGIALIVTATDIETKAVHERIKPANGFDRIAKIYDRSRIYYIGRFGNYHIAHVQSNMGAVGRSSVIITVSQAITSLTPKFVLMVGIAFGVDSEKQKIGDVLISESIAPYDNIKNGESINYRGTTAPSSQLLLSRFKQISTWEFLLPNGMKASKIPAQILSGEELIDNIDRRTELVKSFPNSKGGEMEGAGLYAACDAKVDWILVKGICDFADGKKSENKEEYQNTAINSALSLCFEIFNSDYAFNDLGLNPISEKENHICKLKSEDIDKILFDVYNKDNELYYLPRKEDEKFSNVLGHYCIWIYGISGCGKTNLILRNSILNNYEFTYICLASCLEAEVIDLFKGILYDLEEQLNNAKHTTHNPNFSIVSKNILSLLEDKCKDKTMIISIEEIPIFDSKCYEQFVMHFFALLILKESKQGLNNVKFVLSSIDNPTIHLRECQQKIHQQVKFIELYNWGGEDIKKLIKLISISLDIDVSADFLIKLIETSNNSPRFIKKFFRNILACNMSSTDDYNAILLETERELKQCHND